MADLKSEMSDREEEEMEDNGSEIEDTTASVEVPEPPALEAEDSGGEDEDEGDANIPGNPETEDEEEGGNISGAEGAEEDEDAKLLREMFPNGIGEEEEEDEELEFQEKYNYGDILGEIENEENEEGGDISMNNLGEFAGEDGAEGPTVEQLEHMIHFLDEEKRKSQAGEQEEYAECKTEEPDETGADIRQKMIMVLGPDHPKMIRFQKALKEHLERQIYLVETETRDLELELKDKKRERTDLGSTMYNLQNEMQRQSEQMERCEKDLVRYGDKRAKIEASTEKLKVTVKDLKGQLECEENRERELVQSMKTLDYSEFVVRQAAEKYDGELKIRQLIDEKLEKMKEQSEKQKKDTDFYIDRVMTQIQHMEQINEGIQRQINAHVEEQKQMTTYINEAVTEIEALQIEKVHLQRAWNETISVVRSRDDALVAARQAVEKMEEELRIKDSELKSLVRLITREQEGHEESLVLLRRRKMEEKMLQRQVEKYRTKIQRLKDKLTELYSVKHQVEHDLFRLRNMFAKRNKDTNGPRRQIEKLAMEKIRLEDEILLAMQERTAMDKAAGHIIAKIKLARDRSRHLDADVAKVENQMAQLTLDVAHGKEDLLKKQILVDELERRLAKQEKALQDQIRDIKHSERIIQKKTGEVLLLNKKCQKLINFQGGVEVGPLEQQILEIKKQLMFEKANVTTLQEEWLKRQDHLVLLTTQRDKVIQQNELLRKEVFIMERKKQRLEKELDKKKAEVTKLTRTTEALRKEIRTMNHRLHKDKFDQEQMDKDNVLIQNELTTLLKKSEMEALELEQEIEKLQEEKERLYAGLHEAHDQNLQWEKKVKLAKELKENIKKEQEHSMTSLKLAIHHMQVRFNELSRAQEKLMGDLESSIDQRETIIKRADLSMKRANIHPTKSKLNVHRTLAQLQDRNKHLMKEVKEVEHEVDGLIDNVQQIEDQLHIDNGDLENFKQMIAVTEQKIEEASVQKHKNLLEVILRQQKYKILESVKMNRYKPTAKSLEELDKIIEDIENKCYSLVELSDKLMEEFPETALHLKLVKASILANA